MAPGLVQHDPYYLLSDFWGKLGLCNKSEEDIFLLLWLYIEQNFMYEAKLLVQDSAGHSNAVSNNTN